MSGSSSSLSNSNSTSGTPVPMIPRVILNGLSGGLVTISSDSDDDLPQVSMKMVPSYVASTSNAEPVTATVKTESGLADKKLGEGDKSEKQENKVRHLIYIGEDLLYFMLTVFLSSNVSF